MTNLETTQRIESALKAHPHLACRRVRIETHADGVTLHGVVPTYFHKQLAQEALRRLDGIGRIDNLLEVNWNGASSLASPAL